MKIISFFAIAFFITITVNTAYTQELRGTVFEKNSQGLKSPLPGVNVYWSGTSTGTFTNAEGKFSIIRINETNKLVFSYIGYQSDTIEVSSQQRNVEVVMQVAREITGTEVVARQAGAHVSGMKPIHTQIITQAELQKAACCNLSESFETNASVDVSYTDAISGAKQIQLLGIPGKYSPIMFENIPNLRGLSAIYGLMYVPGPWMESIQVSKGAASVINGFESIGGLINVEYKKPEESERLHLNFFADSESRYEANANAAFRINDHLNSGLLVHASASFGKIDHNKDYFLDQPLTRQINLLNRWSYNRQQWESKFGVRFLAEERLGGQRMGLSPEALNPGNPYLIDINTTHFEAFSKTGRISHRRAATSTGWINNVTWHSINSLYGNNAYKGDQVSWYSNLLFQSFINNTSNVFTTGLSFMADRFEEQLNDSTFNSTELVPGTFFEFTHHTLWDLIIIAGIRLDYHNIHGFFTTPRLHLRYAIDSSTTVRASAGLGYRSPHVIAENNHLLASSRKIRFLNEPEMERAVNFGINLTKCFEINGRLLTINAEAYRTRFLNQLVVDLDRSVNEVYVNNLDGKAFSNSYQVELTWEPIKNLDLVLAYRWNDVMITQDVQLVRKPLVNRYKGLLNVSYATNLRKWQFDFTTQLNGDSRLPDTRSNPEEYRRPELSPPYTIIHAQVTKFFRLWNIYFGAENLTNYTQRNPVIAANDPFGEYFDSSMVWGPLMGRKFYAGIRFTID